MGLLDMFKKGSESSAAALKVRIKAKSRIKHMCSSGMHLDMNAGDERELTGNDVADAILCVRNGWAVNLDTGEDNEPSRKPVTLKIGG